VILWLKVNLNYFSKVLWGLKVKLTLTRIVFGWVSFKGVQLTKGPTKNFWQSKFQDPHKWNSLGDWKRIPRKQKKVFTQDNVEHHVNSSCQLCQREGFPKPPHSEPNIPWLLNQKNRMQIFEWACISMGLGGEEINLNQIHQSWLNIYEYKSNPAAELIMPTNFKFFLFFLKLQKLWTNLGRDHS
jgi:hypothetical protein